MSRNYRKTALVVLAMSAAIAFSPSIGAALAPYSQDFETMTPDQGWPPNDLSADGWQIFGFAWDADPYAGPADQVYAYGPFEAANGGPGSIQSVAVGEGGPAQGDVVLNKYSDYNNSDQTSLYIQALTYREQTIAAGDVGLWRFSYDAKRGNLEADSSAFAYIQTIDPTFFFETASVSNDSTNLPAKWGTYTLDLLIDETMVGDILSFGFSAISTDYNGSAVFYDNLSFGRPDTDTDADGIDDATDNCIEHANADQRDTDGDRIGNACDADLNNDCTVDFDDLGIMKSVFFGFDPHTDLNGDGVVNFLDLGIMATSFYAAPGPSGLPNVCDGNYMTIDFEDSPDSYYFVDFGGGLASVIANPVPGGIDTSAQVGRMLKFAGEVFGGSVLALDTPVNIPADSLINMKVWSPRVVDVLFKFEGLFPAEVNVTHGGSGWEELSFDFGAVSGVFEGITLIFDLGIIGDAAGDPANWTFYFDDISLPTAGLRANY